MYNLNITTGSEEKLYFVRRTNFDGISQTLIIRNYKNEHLILIN